MNSINMTCARLTHLVSENPSPAPTSSALCSGRIWLQDFPLSMLFVCLFVSPTVSWDTGQK